MPDTVLTIAMGITATKTASQIFHETLMRSQIWCARDSWKYKFHENFPLLSSFRSMNTWCIRGGMGDHNPQNNGLNSLAPRTLAMPPQCDAAWSRRYHQEGSESTPRKT